MEFKPSTDYPDFCANCNYYITSHIGNKCPTPGVQLVHNRMEYKGIPQQIPKSQFVPMSDDTNYCNRCRYPKSTHINNECPLGVPKSEVKSMKFKPSEQSPDYCDNCRTHKDAHYHKHCPATGYNLDKEDFPGPVIPGASFPTEIQIRSINKPVPKSLVVYELRFNDSSVFSYIKDYINNLERDAKILQVSHKVIKHKVPFTEAGILKLLNRVRGEDAP